MRCASVHRHDSQQSHRGQSLVALFLFLMEYGLGCEVCVCVS